MSSTTAMPPPSGVTVRRRILWSETDASGYYHFATAFRLFEEAELAILDLVGLLDVVERIPRVHASADFREQLRFGDEVDVLGWVDGVGNSSLTYRFEIRRGDTLCVEGTVVAVLVDRPGGRPVRWTDRNRDRLLSHPHGAN